MKFAAFIFAFAGGTYLALGISFAITTGPRFASLLFVGLMAVALFAQSYSLFRAKPRARLCGLIASAALAICFLAIASILVHTAGSLRIIDYPKEALSLLATVAGVALAFSLAFLFLLVDRRAP